MGSQNFGLKKPSNPRVNSVKKPSRKKTKGFGEVIFSGDLLGLFPSFPSCFTIKATQKIPRGWSHCHVGGVVAWGPKKGQMGHWDKTQKTPGFLSHCGLTEFLAVEVAST